jgi:cytochrome c-type biogenesis protein CcmE
MKSLQKFILPALIILVIILVYFVYFAPSAELGSFRDFDPNNNAVKDIKVLLVAERGINRTSQGGATFYTADKHNTVIQVNADKIPSEIESAEILILRGHLSSNTVFHAHDVLLY